MLILGTRPQIIKSAPIIEEIQKHPEIELQLVHTGQHYDYEMSKTFFAELELPEPVANLAVKFKTHAQQVGNMMIKIERVIHNVNPDMVLVPGDTNSALAGALASAKMNVPVFHVEAGCRIHQPIPEETNRVLIDHCSNLLFAVSQNCLNNLRKEGLKGFISGDTMYDSLLKHLPNAKGLFSKDTLFILLTLHRPENVDNPLTLITILKSLDSTGLPIVFPKHPRTQIPCKLNNLASVKPLPYQPLLKAIMNAKLVVTDSGGLQKEAFWLKTPCVTVRDRTEWSETVEAGCNLLVSKDAGSIVKGVNEMLDKEFPKATNPYGDGYAAQKIVKELLSYG